MNAAVILLFIIAAVMVANTAIRLHTFWRNCIREKKRKYMESVGYSRYYTFNTRLNETEFLWKKCTESGTVEIGEDVLLFMKLSDIKKRFK